MAEPQAAGVRRRGDGQRRRIRDDTFELEEELEHSFFHSRFGFS